MGSRFDAGLLLERIVEPVPDPEAIRAVPALAKALEGALFLHFRAVRDPLSGDAPGARRARLREALGHGAAA